MLDRPQSVQRVLRRLQGLLTPLEREALLALFRGAQAPEGGIARLGLELENGESSRFLGVAVLGVQGRAAGIYYGKSVALARPGMRRGALLALASRKALSALRRQAYRSGGLLGRWREAYLRARPGLPPLPEGLFPVKTEVRGALFLTLAEGRRGEQLFLLAGRGGEPARPPRARPLGEALGGAGGGPPRPPGGAPWGGGLGGPS